MEIRCPHCDTRYELAAPVTANRRLRLRCAVCSGLILGPRPDGSALGTAPTLDDKTAWHRTLARALVSDLRAEDPRIHAHALGEDRLLDVFAVGLADAWLRFRSVAGASESALFRDAVRDILGEGREILPDAGSGTA